jgi:RNAse (barnase) inhibitor barstar
MDRQNKPNTDDQQKNMANSRYKFNNTTRKMDDLSPAEIEDKIEAIEDFEETNVIKEKYDETLNTLWNDIQKPIKNYIDPIGRPSIESDDSKVIEVIDVLEDIMKDLKQRLKPTKKWFK